MHKRRAISNTKSMKILGYILIALIFLITIRLKVGITLQYDILRNYGRIKVTLFHIPLFVRDISLASGYIKLVYGKKTSQIKLDLSDKNIRYLKHLNEGIVERVYIDKVQTDFNIALENPYICSMVCGSVHAIAGLALSKIKNSKSDATVGKTVNIGYFQNEIQFKVLCKLEITLFDCIWANVIAKYKTKREVVYG